MLQRMRTAMRSAGLIALIVCAALNVSGAAEGENEAAPAAFMVYTPSMATAETESAEPQTLEQRIAAIAEKPGHWDQMCSTMMETPYNNYIQFFGFTRGDMMISTEQFRELRAQREEVIAIVREAIGNYELKESDPFTIMSSREYFVYQSHLLMLLDLNASETLEDLIAAAKRQAPADPQQQPAPGAYNRTLATILALLYYERDPAVINSEQFMKPWRDKLNGEHVGKSAVDYAALEENSRRFYMFDPWEQRAAGYHAYCGLKLTPELQREILQLAQDFVARVPVEQRARAKNMLAEPIMR